MIGKIAFLLVVSLVVCSAVRNERPANLLPGLSLPNYEVRPKSFSDGHPRIVRSAFPAPARETSLPNGKFCVRTGPGK